MKNLKQNSHPFVIFPLSNACIGQFITTTTVFQEQKYLRERERGGGCAYYHFRGL